MRPNSGDTEDLDFGKYTPTKHHQEEASDDGPALKRTKVRQGETSGSEQERTDERTTSSDGTKERLSHGPVEGNSGDDEKESRSELIDNGSKGKFNDHVQSSEEYRGDHGKHESSEERDDA